jgi:hypothetical protein
MFYSNSIKSGKTLYTSKNGGFNPNNNGVPGGYGPQSQLGGNGGAQAPQHQRVKSQLQKNDKLEQITNFYN